MAKPHGNSDLSIDLTDSQCTAIAKGSQRRCQRRAVPGGTVCAMHGGNAPQVRRKAEQRLEQAAMARQVSVWGGRTDISPPEALLELVQTKAAEVAYWQYRTNQLDPTVLLGKQPHSSVQMLHKAQDQLAAYASAAVKAGLDEALVRLHTLQGGLLLQALRQAVATARATTEADDDVVRQVLTELGGAA